MAYLALSIICSAFIVLILKGFPRYQVNSFQAIVFNYAVCTLMGLLYADKTELILIPTWSGLPLAVFLGSIFIALFYLIARTTQVMGVTVASVAQKLSFVIPGVIGILVFHENFTIIKFIGLIMAVYAVFLVSAKDDSIDLKGKLWMPLTVFAGSGVCDLVVKIVETYHLQSISSATFTFVLFGTAMTIGTLRILFLRIKGNIVFSGKDILAGIILGVPNYGSIYFLIKALQKSGLESSQVFPINNVGIILLSAVSAWIIYREYLNKRQIVGLLIAVIAIFVLI